MYIDIDLVIDGALAETKTVFDDGALDAYVADIQRCAALFPNLEYRVYIVRHEHPDDGAECACVQYANHHHPYVTFGGNDS